LRSYPWILVHRLQLLTDHHRKDRYDTPQDTHDQAERRHRNRLRIHRVRRAHPARTRPARQA
jgi:hypothetical protein